MNNLINLKTGTTYQTSNGEIHYLGTKNVTCEDGKKRKMARVKIGDADEILMSVYDVKLMIGSNSQSKPIEQNIPSETVQKTEKHADAQNHAATTDDKEVKPNPDVIPNADVIPNPEEKKDVTVKRDSFLKELKDGFLWWFGVRK